MTNNSETFIGLATDTGAEEQLTAQLAVMTLEQTVAATPRAVLSTLVVVEATLADPTADTDGISQVGMVRQQRDIAAQIAAALDATQHGARLTFSVPGYHHPLFAVDGPEAVPTNDELATQRSLCLGGIRAAARVRLDNKKPIRMTAQPPTGVVYGVYGA